MSRRPVFLLVAAVLAAAPGRAEDNVDALQEQAIKAAARKAAPFVVQIETSGGSDVITNGPRGGGMVRKGTGPTTGVVVGADGYIISSAFNFANKPSSIFVAVPGQKERLVAQVVATDQSRFLTLLKVKATGLPVAPAAPKAGIRVGHTAIALGRTLSPLVDQPPSVSVGIISAVGRIWGRALQTDAKISPANYGGPIVDLEGRVQGILVPASPRAEGETAGVEWYDSGIGFAIPLEDVFAVLGRLKEGKDIKKGQLGITPQSQDIYSVAPTVAVVAPESAAAKAGIKPGDIIKEIDGKPVVNQAQVMHHLGTRYEGDVITVKVQRGKEEKTFANLLLTGQLTTFKQSFLGVLPVRDDPELGVEVRYVYSKSPAEAAGLKEGDRITKIGSTIGQLAQFSGRDQILEMLASAPAGTEIKLEVVRKAGKKTETLTVKLGDVPDTVAEKLPTESTKKQALVPRKQLPVPGMPPGMPPTPPGKGEKKDGDKKEEDKEAKKEDGKEEKKPETGLLKRTNEAQDHKYWVYVPTNYDPNIAHALVVWLHPVGKNKDKDVQEFTDYWSFACEDQHLILVGPAAENETGWIPSEADFITETVNKVAGQYTIDRRRVIAHGMGLGGQMAFYLGFHNRDLIRAVATTGAALNNQVKERTPAQPLAFFIHAGGKDPLAQAIADTKTKLSEQKYPVIYRVSEDKGHQYLEAIVLDEFVRWIDSLDAL